MTKLSVNINKIATIRNARGGNTPNVLKTALDCELFGAEGITVHPRPDQRHIRYTDVEDLSHNITTEFNVEGYPNKEFLDLVCGCKTDQVTLVPDAPDVLTSNAGWDCKKHFDRLKDVVQLLQSKNKRVSLFIDPVPKQLEWAKKTGAERVELYTEDFSTHYDSNPEKAIAPYRKAALIAQELQLGLNAGHDLNLKNLAYFKQNIPGLMEVSIGHALISDALYYGLDNTIKMYLAKLR
jgi:pyridoxine 5-phosphate synthase